VTPTRTYDGPSGPCREFTTVTEIDGQQERVCGTGCRQPEGTWRTIAAAVDGHVLIYIHKERTLDDVEDRYPAWRYVLIEDKPRILDAVKGARGERVTTVLPRQGHYAHDAEALASTRAPDLAVERIGDLLRLDLPALAATRR
jgi:hypothetical protein